MKAETEENEDLEQLIEEVRERQREQWERMDPRFREYLEQRYFRHSMYASRKYPERKVAGIPPELARILDLTEDEILKYSAK